ncbi:hypothetical protein [Lichenicoccus roseus]|uniref:hypothetical protein n=1 Tax=Lichenicoccus roseus TaxID=2683649 RepID=UPI001F114B03|nr:hypothetical protein [Lichenicoccus roseus]
MLFAACLEAIGLRPVIVLTKGHAFTGVWLSSFDAGRSMLQDLPGLRNRLTLGDLRVFETTLVTSIRKPTFAAACQQGQANLRPAEDQDETDFREVIDIHQPCLRRIHPLPTIVAALAEPGGATVSEPDEQPAFEAPPPCGWTGRSYRLPRCRPTGSSAGATGCSTCRPATGC